MGGNVGLKQGETAKQRQDVENRKKKKKTLQHLLKRNTSQTGQKKDWQTRRQTGKNSFGVFAAKETEA